MKKYLLGLFAIALAIGFSAFTVSSKKEATTSTVEFYWYVVDENGALVAEFNSGDPLSRLDAKASGGSCEENEGIECLRGYSVPLSEPQFPIEEPAEGDEISIFKVD